MCRILLEEVFMDSRLVIGLFDSRDKAIEAIQDLKAQKFSETDMGMLSREGGRAEGVDSIPSHQDRAAAGGLGGAFIGASIGTLIGLGVLAGVVPVIGPAIAAGTLGVLASNAAGGMALAGLTGALVGFGLKRDEAEVFEKEVQAGKTIVTLRTDNVAEAVLVMQRHGAEVRAHSPADSENAAADAKASAAGDQTLPYDPLAAQPLFADVGPGAYMADQAEKAPMSATPTFTGLRSEPTVAIDQQLAQNYPSSDPAAGVDLASAGAAGTHPGYAAHSQSVDEPGLTAPATPREDVGNPRAYRDDSDIQHELHASPVAAWSDEEKLTRSTISRSDEPTYDPSELGNDQPVLPSASEDSTPILPPQPPSPIDADPALLVPVGHDDANIPGDEVLQSEVAQATQLNKTPAAQARKGLSQSQRAAPGSASKMLINEDAAKPKPENAKDSKE